MYNSLEPNEVFVFGSNMHGFHLGGAAQQAYKQFGAEWGIEEGLTGQCYAFPTFDEEMVQLPLEAIEHSVRKLFATARALPFMTFLLTKVGCGIAGFSEEQIAPLFKDSPKNIIKPIGW